MKESLGVGEIAKMLGVTGETARQWSASGKIPAFRFDENGRWKAYREDMIEWIESRKSASMTSGKSSPSEQSS